MHGNICLHGREGVQECNHRATERNKGQCLLLQRRPFRKSTLAFELLFTRPVIAVSSASQHRFIQIHLKVKRHRGPSKDDRSFANSAQTRARSLCSIVSLKSAREPPNK